MITGRTSLQQQLQELFGGIAGGLLIPQVVQYHYSQQVVQADARIMQQIHHSLSDAPCLQDVKAGLTGSPLWRQNGPGCMQGLVLPEKFQAGAWSHIGA